MLAIVLTIWLAMWLARDTPCGRVMHDWLVAKPAARLSRIRRGQVMLGLLSLAIIISLIGLLENDGRMLVAFGRPEFMAFAAAIDLSALLDLAAVAVIAASTIRLRHVRLWLGQRLRPRARRPRTAARRMHRPANDDEDRPALAA